MLCELTGTALFCHNKKKMQQKNGQQITHRGKVMLQGNIRSLCFATIIAASILLPAQAQTVFSGQTRGGAYYSIAVPDAWNGSLVVWNHGYDFAPVAPNPDLGPLAAIQLSEGYAVAASSYQQSQWAVFRTRKDIERLVDEFEELVGQPSSIILTGASLGGIVTADALERAKIDGVVGAYTACGAMGGSRTWDGAHDLRLTYDAICGDIPEAAIPGGATGLPRGVTSISAGEVATKVNACMGLLTPPQLQTQQQQAKLQKFLASTQIPASFIIGDMFFATNGVSNLIFDRGKLKGKQGLGNIGVEYADPEINATIERVRANRGAAKKLKKNFTPRGDFREDELKIVSIHTDKDGLVLVENQKEYQDVVDADTLTVAVVVEDSPTHCGFTQAEFAAGWESLRFWLAGFPQPDAAALQANCQGIESLLPGSGPCRFDASFEIPDMDGRIPPRDNTAKKKKKLHDHDSDDNSDDDSDSHGH